MQKVWYTSKAILAGGLLIAYGVLGYFGFVIEPDSLTSVLTGVGIVGIRDALD